MLILIKYDGKIPSKYNEAVIIVDKNGEISDYALYTLGIKDPSELKGLMKDLASGKEITSKEIFESYFKRIEEKETEIGNRTKKELLGDYKI